MAIPSPFNTLTTNHFRTSSFPFSLHFEDIFAQIHYILKNTKLHFEELYHYKLKNFSQPHYKMKNFPSSGPFFPPLETPSNLRIAPQAPTAHYILKNPLFCSLHFEELQPAIRLLH